MLQNHKAFFPPFGDDQDANRAVENEDTLNAAAELARAIATYLSTDWRNLDTKHRHLAHIGDLSADLDARAEAVHVDRNLFRAEVEKILRWRDRTASLIVPVEDGVPDLERRQLVGARLDAETGLQAAGKRLQSARRIFLERKANFTAADEALRGYDANKAARL